MKQIVLGVIYFISFFIVSCTEEQAIPKHILAQDTFAIILSEMHVVEAANALGHLDSTVTGHSLSSFQQGIYKKHNITKSQFDSSYSFYTARPELFETVYEKVLINLSQKQALLSKKTS